MEIYQKRFITLLAERNKDGKTYLDVLKTVLKEEGGKYLKGQLLIDFTRVVNNLKGDGDEIKYSKALKGCSDNYARNTLLWGRGNFVRKSNRAFLLQLCTGYCTSTQRSILEQFFETLEKIRKFGDEKKGTGGKFGFGKIAAFDAGAVRSVLLHFLCHPRAKWSIADEDCSSKVSMDAWLTTELND